MPRSDRGKRARKPQPYDFAEFRGYRGPRFTPLPDEFLDHQLADLTSAETKVMLFLFRKTYGYRKSGDHVSFAQLQFGTVSADGTIIDRGTGLSKATVWRALKGLQSKGLIEVYRQITRAGDPDVNYYRIREYSDADQSRPGSASPDGLPDDRGPSSGPTTRPSRQTPNSTRTKPRGGWSSSDTTPVSELNHPHSGTKPRGGLTPKPTREHYTRDNYTLSPALLELARDFLASIGYPRPSQAKRERTIHILTQLNTHDGYSLDELQTACEIAVAVGARGPELIPHVIGQDTDPDIEVGERVAAQESAERDRWEGLAEEFDGLPEKRQHDLLVQARESSGILAKRPLDHPLVRAAAIAALENR
jgi:hypothetical protein